MNEVDTIAAIEKADGMLSTAAKRLGCTRDTLNTFIAANPRVQVAYADTIEHMGDVAESELFKLIRAGDYKAIAYYLSTKHRHRGYGLKYELGGIPGQPLQVEDLSTQTVIAALERLTKSVIDPAVTAIDITPKPNGHTNGSGNGHVGNADGSPSP